MLTCDTNASYSEMCGSSWKYSTQTLVHATVVSTQEGSYGEGTADVKAVGTHLFSVFHTFHWLIRELGQT